MSIAEVNIGRVYNAHYTGTLNKLEILQGQSTDGPAIYSNDTSIILSSYNSEISVTVNIGILIVANTYYTIQMKAKCDNYDSSFNVKSTSGSAMITETFFTFKSPIIASSDSQYYVENQNWSVFHEFFFQHAFGIN